MPPTSRLILAALLLAGCARPSAAAGPLVITRGGTYTGTWSSDDPATPAVAVRTAEPVVLDHADLRSRGPLIAVLTPHADVTVRDCRGVGLNPNVAGQPPGRFLSAESFDRITIEHCDLSHTAGIYLLTNADPTRTGAVRIVANHATDIDGRRSDGHNGWLPFNARRSRRDGRRELGYAVVQFVQLDKVRAPGMEIAWNAVTNAPGDSRVEDNVNVYQSGGTATSPLLVRNNLIDGAYPIDPAVADRQDADWTYDNSYSGGGLLLGDGPGPTPAAASSFIVATGNDVVGTVNYGIAIAAGHDINFDHNLIVSAGQLPDGRRIPAQNVGAYIWNANHGKRTDSFFNDGGSDNTIGWTSAKGGRNDSWMPDAAYWTAAVPLPGPITPADEATTRTVWHARATAAGITVGYTSGREPRR